MADDLTEAEAAVAEAKAEFEAAQEKAAEAQKVLLEKQAIMDAAITARDGTPDPHQDQIDRMLYIRSQADQRAHRHGITQRLREALPELTDLSPASPLDKALKGDRSRGKARPKVPAKDAKE